MIRIDKGNLASVTLVRRAAQGLLTTAFSLMLLTSLIFAQDNDPTTDSRAASPPAGPGTDRVQAVESDTPEVPENPHVAENEAKKRKKVVVVLAAVAGVAILGVGAIAVTMVWARRLRRMARDPGPRQTTVGNDFWFLKPEKAKIADSSREDGQPPPQSPLSTESPE